MSSPCTTTHFNGHSIWKPQKCPLQSSNFSLGAIYVTEFTSKKDKFCINFIGKSLAYLSTITFLWLHHSKINQSVYTNRTKNIQLTTTITWLWWWHPLRLSKRQSPLPTTVLLGTTLTRTIRLPPDSNHLIYCILLLSWSEDRTEIQRCELEFQRKHEWDTNTIASTVIKFLMVMCDRKYREPFPF